MFPQDTSCGVERNLSTSFGNSREHFGCAEHSANVTCAVSSTGPGDKKIDHISVFSQFSSQSLERQGQTQGF